VNRLGSVTMQAQREVPPDMQCKDKFLVQSAIVAKEIMPKEVTGDMVISHVLVCFVIQRFIFVVFSVQLL